MSDLAVKPVGTRRTLAQHFAGSAMVIEVPALRPDGTILNTPGYDPATLLYYAPAPDLTLPAVSDCPDAREVARSLALIESIIGEFPFVDQASRANAIALILTPFLRAAIRGSVPKALIDATAAGTGKTKVDLIPQFERDLNLAQSQIQALEKAKAREIIDLQRKVEGERQVRQVITTAAQAITRGTTQQDLKTNIATLKSAADPKALVVGSNEFSAIAAQAGVFEGSIASAEASVRIGPRQTLPM